ncbi:MAG: hypothetical protein CSA97_01405 [Bacteroidetes bacterium]|nr:MAG: hypothetical protein CSA97_01405 [Bacteroidota bacterium]
MAQVQDVYPTSVKGLNFSKAGEQQFKKKLKRFEALIEGKMQGQGLGYDQLSPADRQLYDWGRNFSEDSPSYYVEYERCWMHRHGPVASSASSHLQAQGRATYNPENALDCSYKTAWVEGVKGNGIGESISFTFAEPPQVEVVYIANGYVKSAQAWRDNGRVKMLRVYVDGVAKYDFYLKDKRAVQGFVIPRLSKCRTLRFEILAVYPGAKYQDVAISEFDFGYLMH